VILGLSCNLIACARARRARVRRAPTSNRSLGGRWRRPRAYRAPASAADIVRRCGDCSL